MEDTIMKEQLIAIIAEYLGKETLEIDADATFEDLGLDSLDIAELVINIEEELGVTIELSADLNNIDKLVDYLESQG
jgi:acyl carrier protein